MSSNLKTKEKSFYITTLGCPKNVADSRSMGTSLLTGGLLKADSPDESKFHIINTCTFIQTATEETIETILDAAKITKQNGQKLIVVGCFAERYPGAIEKDIPEVDFFFGTGKYDKAFELIKEKFPEEFILEPNSDLLRREILYEIKGKPYSYIKLSDGCNRACHFCIIPNLRGEYRDEKEEEILKQVKLACENGSKEICLVSQDSVFYGKDTDKLISLLHTISGIEGLEILRLLYLYPDKKTYRLLDVFKENPKIAPYFESPVQHVSESVLKNMNRTGSYSFFKELFTKAREVPGMEVRTSFILGYPGETAKDVDLLLRFVEEIKPEKLALFAFSPQEDTKAFKLKSTVSKKEAARRINLVREVYHQVLKDIHLSRMGKEYPCIVEEKENDSLIVRRFQDAPEIDEIVHIDEFSGDIKIGDIGKVRIDSFLEYDMTGTWIN
ncbi:MAG: MiaB/RimO family radical SAM methylthiotransferase [Leptospiraceae bacterium]|nr:MiaB/RimO family radical SAM methylthiotransferase [Leptospiraceae bacterium]